MQGLILSVRPTNKKHLPEVPFRRRELGGRCKGCAEAFAVRLEDCSNSNLSLTPTTELYQHGWTCNVDKTYTRHQALVHPPVISTDPVRVLLE